MSTYRVRLLEYHDEPEETTFGTCEICMYTGTATNPTYTMEFTDTETGEKSVHDVEGYSWSWGDYFTVEISNVIHFGDWLEDNHITVSSVLLGYNGLERLVYQWEETFEED